MLLYLCCASLPLLQRSRALQRYLIATSAASLTTMLVLPVVLLPRLQILRRLRRRLLKLTISATIARACLLISILLCAFINTTTPTLKLATLSSHVYCCHLIDPHPEPQRISPQPPRDAARKAAVKAGLSRHQRFSSGWTSERTRTVHSR